MPFDSSVKKVLILGSGPIIIGQAAEFDYSGTQSCLVFKDEGIETVLVNSNPATIMTDPDIADNVYIEPLCKETIEQIILKEKPSHVYPGVGGQTALNIVCELEEFLFQNEVKCLGTKIKNIKRGEDREKFKDFLKLIDEPVVDSQIVTHPKTGEKAARELGYPVIVRPAYTLGGAGGGFANDESELKLILPKAIKNSPIGQALIEKSVKGFKEIEFEIIRDKQGNVVTVCAMENLDPIGIHTGDSIVVAPCLTLNNAEFQRLRTAAVNIVNRAEIIGACNVQFAIDPTSEIYYVIEINPRVSRSSALASKVTGYPIAKVSSKVALGYFLDEIQNEVTKKTYACFEPAIDYVVVKIPKWPFDKFITAKKDLGTKMMSTGEVMAIGKSFEQALFKGIRSIDPNQHVFEKESCQSKTIEELKNNLQKPDDERLFCLAEIIRRGYDLLKISKITGIDLFFIQKIKVLVDLEEKLKTLFLCDLTKDFLIECKKLGFSDKGISKLVNDASPNEIYTLRQKLGISPSFNMVDTCAGEFKASSPYYYSCYDLTNESIRSERKKILIIGSGPIRIGQGIEFDYCCVRSLMALTNEGIETILINNNPETVSTDFNMSEKLYFEPITEEEVLNIIDFEKPDGVILQFGGQTAIKLAKFLDNRNIKILGTSSKNIDISENRDKFDNLLENLNIKRPKGKAILNLKEGLEIARFIGYPVLARPSYVLGGQGMEIIYDETNLIKYLTGAFKINNKYPILIDKYIEGREIEVDAVCDGQDVFIPGVIEHIDKAGVHSGDSICVYPPINLSDSVQEEICKITRKICLNLAIIGIINIQFIESENEIYVIEVNPRSSRTVPFISKVTNCDIVALATGVMIGKKLSELDIRSGINQRRNNVFSIKFPVFSTEKLPMVEVSLGPEMRSTGEVLGIAKNLPLALKKGFLAANFEIPNPNGIILATVADKEKSAFLPFCQRLYKLGMGVVATTGTANILRDNGICAQYVRKISETSPNIVDVVEVGVIDLIINIPSVGNDSSREGFKIRRLAAENNVSLLTSLDSVACLVNVLENVGPDEKLEVLKLSEIFAK